MNLAGQIAPAPPPFCESYSGDVEDVATFFKVSVRTVHNWKDSTPPELPYFQNGRNIVFLETDVVAFIARGYVANRRMLPGDAESLARTEWRKHLGLRSTYRHMREMYQRLKTQEDRIDAVEEKFERAIRGGSIDTEQFTKDEAA